MKEHLLFYNVLRHCDEVYISFRRNHGWLYYFLKLPGLACIRNTPCVACTNSLSILLLSKLSALGQHLSSGLHGGS